MDTSSHPPSSPSCPMIRRDKRRVMNRTERRQKGSRFSDLIWSDLIWYDPEAEQRDVWSFCIMSYIVFIFFTLTIFFFYLWFWKEVRVGDRDRFTLRCKDSRVLFCRLLFIVSALRARGTTQTPVFRSHPQTVMTGSIQSARSPFLPSFPLWCSEASPFMSPHPERRFERRNGPNQTMLASAHGTQSNIHLQACEGQKRDSFCTEIHCSSMSGWDERILRTARHSTMKLSGSFDLYFTSC